MLEDEMDELKNKILDLISEYEKKHNVMILISEFRYDHLKDKKDFNITVLKK